MDVEELIGRLCVTAGMIMEDASVEAISVGQSQLERVAALLRAGDAISALANAAEALNDYRLNI
jgi:hypothetical protein